MLKFYAEHFRYIGRVNCFRVVGFEHQPNESPSQVAGLEHMVWYKTALSSFRVSLVGINKFSAPLSVKRLRYPSQRKQTPEDNLLADGILFSELTYLRLNPSCTKRFTGHDRFA